MKQWGSMSRKFYTAAAVCALFAGSVWAGIGPTYKVFPNPVRADRGVTQVEFRDVVGGKIKIFNSAGRLVLERPLDAGQSSFIWDLKNNDGKDVAAGIYVYFLESDGQERTGKIGIIR